MNVREMHIEVQQSTQQVAANRSRKFLPEEIDWVLNKMQERFVQSKLRPRLDAQGRFTGGFELDQLQADAIRMLLVTGKSLVPYLTDDGRRYKCFLPADYKFLIADYSFTTLLCGAIPDVQAAKLYITRLRQDQSGKAAGPFYATLTASINGKAVAIPGDLPYGNSYTGYPEKADVSFLKDWILWKGSWYWERFDDMYYPGSYLQVQTAAPAGATAMTVDGTVVTNQEALTRDLRVHPGTGSFHVNRLSPSEVIPSLNGAAFYKSSHFSPISELAGNILWLYRDSSFTVNGVEISYIRKPQPISLSLNTDCELAPDFHQSICDLAVEYLKGRVGDEKGTMLAKSDLVERVIL